jgi:hypothetical protein
MRQTKPLSRRAGMLLVASMALVGLGSVKAGSAMTWPTQGWPRGAPADVGLDAGGPVAVE